MANDDTNSTTEFTKNIKNYQDPDDYPTSYAMLSRTAGVGIIDYLNNLRDDFDRAYANHIKHPDMKEDYLEYSQHIADKIQGARNVLRVAFGIYAEAWGKDGKYILATRDDCKKYNENLDKEDDTVEASNYNFWNDRSWPEPEGNRFTRSSGKYRNLAPKDYAYNESKSKSSDGTITLTFDKSTNTYYDQSTGYYYKPVAHDAVARDNDITLPTYNSITLS